VEFHAKQSDAFDKAVLTLSGGALGVSMTFIHQIVQSPSVGSLWILGMAWSAFACSILAILISLLTGQWAINKAIQQIDANTIHDERAGLWYAQVTSGLNITACGMFVLGVGLMAWFCLENLHLMAHTVGKSA
jgi:hypothetical protein